MLFRSHILRHSAIKDLELEGCLSFPGLRVPIERSLEVLVSYKTCDLNGENERIREINLNRFNSRVFQHEYQHGRGQTFLDDLLPVRKSLYKDKYKKILKKIERAKNV